MYLFCISNGVQGCCNNRQATGSVFVLAHAVGEHRACRLTVKKTRLLAGLDILELGQVGRGFRSRQGWKPINVSEA